jgi:hypothetical protein
MLHKMMQETGSAAIIEWWTKGSIAIPSHSMREVVRESNSVYTTIPLAIKENAMIRGSFIAVSSATLTL